jgi:hypothetical protein
VIGPRGRLFGLALAALIAAAAGCGGGQSGIIVGPAPTPTGGATPTPAPCGTPIANGVFVAMASYITATTDPIYGLINGYALVATDGTYSNVAQPIRVRPGDVLQFVNVEPAPTASQAPIQHSAVSLQGATFPAATPSPSPTPTPLSSASPGTTPGPTPAPIFTSSAQSPIGSSISTALWSTGRVPASASDTLCYSQSFTTPVQGTYAFGDYDYYVSTNMRDVIIVTSSATQSHGRTPAGLIRAFPNR